MAVVKLKVMEASQEEAYKGIVRIDSETMHALGVRPGDFVEIEGERKTVAIVDRAYPADIGQNIIRMDGILRRNARTGIGENVSVRKADVKEAKHITIAPAQEGITIQANPLVFKNGLLGRVVVKGDLVVLGGARRRRRTLSGSPFEEIFETFEREMSFGFSRLRLIVAETNPKQPVIITENTEVKLNPKAVQISEEKIIDVSYEDVGGLDEEVKKVREMVEIPLKYPELFNKLGINPPAGVLLHGPPGSGKTLLAKAVANESDANFILLNGPEIMNKFYGESEKRVREVFEQAEKQAPSIIFIDEIDSIAPKRDETHGEVERRVVSQLLTMMDGLKSRGKVIVIGATNRPNSLDPALRRPGRFDREITIGVPSRKGRLEILKIHTRNMPLRGSFYNDIAEKELLSKVDSLVKKYHQDLDKLQEEIRKLNEDKEKTEGSYIDLLLDKIRGLEEKRNKLEEESRIIESLKKLLEENKKKFKVIIQEIKEIEQSDEIWDSEDPRKAFLKIAKDKLKKDILSIINSLFEQNILDKEIYNNIRLKGIQRDLKALADITHGFVGADLESLCKEAAMHVLKKITPHLKLKEKEPISPDLLEKIQVTEEDFKAALRTVRPSAMREVLVETPKVGWSDIGGLEKIKQELKEAVEWPLKYPEAFKRMGVRPPRGILLYGPPGTGKTLMAKAVARESEANFIHVKGPSLLNKWVGESEKGIRKIFEKARQASPAIIFFDEIDALTPRRGMYHGGSNVTENMVNTLLAEMDGLEELNDVVIIGATNRPDIIDPALLRPGRFDRLLLTETPDKKARLEIFKIHTKNMPLAKDVSLNQLAEKTQGYVGSDIESVCREAAMLALREDIKSKEIKKKYFEEAIKKIKLSVPKEAMEKYQQIEEEYLRNAKAALREAPSYMG